MALEKETQKFISDAQEHIKKIAAKWLFVFEKLNKDNGLDFMEFIETDLGYEVKAYIAGITQTLEAFSVFDADGIRNIENSLEEYVEKIKAKIKATGGESLSTGESNLAMKDENGNWYTNTGERLVPHSVAMHAIAVNCEARERSVNS